MRPVQFARVPLFLCAALLMSPGMVAAKVKLSRSWADPGSETRRYEKLVVVGIAATPALRRGYEQAFVDELQLRTVAATPSSEMATEARLDRVAMNDRLRQAGVAGLVVVRLVDPATIGANYSSLVSDAGPPVIYHGGWHGYWANGMRNASTSAFSAPHQEYRVETCMYDTRNDNLVWSSLSLLPVSRADASVADMKPVIETLVADMERYKLVPPLPKQEKEKRKAAAKSKTK